MLGIFYFYFLRWKYFPIQRSSAVFCTYTAIFTLLSEICIRHALNSSSDILSHIPCIAVKASFRKVHAPIISLGNSFNFLHETYVGGFGECYYVVVNCFLFWRNVQNLKCFHSLPFLETIAVSRIMNKASISMIAFICNCSKLMLNERKT